MLVIGLFILAMVLIGLGVELFRGKFPNSNIPWKLMLLGYYQIDVEIIREDNDLVVPLPEGVYSGSWKEDRVRYWYTKPLGKIWDKIHPPKWRYGWQGNIPGGIPINGRGEHSYGYEMDGIYSLSTGPKASPEALSGTFVKSVLEARRNYGGPYNLPHAMSVKEAEEWMAHNG